MPYEPISAVRCMQHVHTKDGALLCTLQCPIVMPEAHQVGAFESSKSAMKTDAPEFKALMTILRSTGPVISTRRSRRSFGKGATCSVCTRWAIWHVMAHILYMHHCISTCICTTMMALLICSLILHRKHCQDYAEMTVIDNSIIRQTMCHNTHLPVAITN